MTKRVDERTGESLNELFDALSHQYRRYVLWALANPDRPPDDSVGTSQFVPSGAEPDVLQIELVHTHFPKLDDRGFVDWDPEAETLARGPRFDEIAPFIELMNENRDEIPQNWP